MTTITERVRRHILGARITPAEIKLSAVDANALARELAETSPELAQSQAELFGCMLRGEAKFMMVPIRVTDVPDDNG